MNNNGLFITLNNEEALKLYLNNGVYGTLMNPLQNNNPNSTRYYFKTLGDYASARNGTEIFFFCKRNIYYGGVINKDINGPAFYLNGSTSLFNNSMNSIFFWDETNRYSSTNPHRQGVFIDKNGKEKTQPFIILFETNEDTGKNIISDDFYFELGKYTYPLPTNTITAMSFCTMTPGETSILKELIKKSSNKIKYDEATTSCLISNKPNICFKTSLLNINHRCEAELEFNILSNYKEILSQQFQAENHSLCRQIPICPFKPKDLDKADIALFDKGNLIKDGTIPNILIEVKKDSAGIGAYRQVYKYLKWLQQINTEQDFEKIKAYIIAPKISKIYKSRLLNEDILDFIEKIKLYSLNEEKFIEIIDNIKK